MSSSAQVSITNVTRRFHIAGTAWLILVQPYYGESLPSNYSCYRRPSDTLALLLSTPVVSMEDLHYSQEALWRPIP